MAKFSRFDSPAVIYMEGEEPSLLRSPEAWEDAEPAKTTLQLSALSGGSSSDVIQSSEAGPLGFGAKKSAFFARAPPAKKVSRERRFGVSQRKK